MMYHSTRDPFHKKYTAAEVIKMGLAPDGGLFIPETIPSLPKEEIADLCKDSYPVRAAKILSKFLTDYTYEELLSDCEAAYAETSFPGGAAPLVHIHFLLQTGTWIHATAIFNKQHLFFLLVMLFASSYHKRCTFTILGLTKHKFCVY